MDLLTILPILDTALTRETVSTKTDTPTVSWKTNTTFTTTINEDTIPNTQRICIHNKNNTPQLYLHTTKTTLKKYTLTDIETITIGD
jgi:hypothetical protein